MSKNIYKKIDTGMKSSLRSWERFVPFLLSSPVLFRRSWEVQGARRERVKKKKVYKIFKSTETSPIACGNKFPLTFYFRFVRNGSRTGRCTNERWERRKKKNCKKRKKDVRWLKCQRGTSGNISTTSLCVKETVVMRCSES